MQSALKAELGLLVEAWGGSGDFGRDAYCPVRLHSGGTEIDGPTIFQVKFIENANSAGADFSAAVQHATAKEVSRIQKRRASRDWIEPRNYFFYTNAPVASRSRRSIEEALQHEFPQATIHINGGSDICALLDLHPELRRSFPELLSLRDLDALLKDAVNAEVLQRSLAAVEETRELVPVFVPTQAYDKTWRVLEEHSFAVLDGPPEMGKTAIARTVAFGHLLADWQAIDCRRPGDFFAAYDGRLPQIFVADDAFGRTEFDPTLANEWERDLPKIITRLDTKHRLIWTTRKHILQRALYEMDLSGKARKFPSPGEIVVTAEDLSLEERARILYRHGKLLATHMGRDFIRRASPQLVNDKHFTPERIRRLVTEVIPELLNDGRANDEEITQALVAAIRNPSDRMRKSFRKLSDQHQWLLISMLQMHNQAGPSALFQCFQDFGQVTQQQFDVLLDQVVGTFVKRKMGTWRSEVVDWIHPSYRDLVIEELRERPDRREAFINNASITGLILALSTTGGADGDRSLPLMPDSAATATFANRARHLCLSPLDTGVLTVLLGAIATAVQGTDEPKIADALRTLAHELAAEAVKFWNSSGKLYVFELQRFIGPAKSLGLPLPDINDLWLSHCQELKEALGGHGMPDAEEIEDWGDLRNIIEVSYGRFAASNDFMISARDIEESLFERVEDELSRSPDPSEPDDNNNEADRIASLADALGHVGATGANEFVRLRLTTLADEFRSYAGVDSDLSYDRKDTDRAALFDLEAFFRDL
ncbi:MAG TPA: hypothetical protein VGQ65_16865 [Thermoanaerobaculia bacterium]|nr:hypothetical protein [Thermoanaerobaculia bacterium]